MPNLPWEALLTLLGILAASLPQLTSHNRLTKRITFWTGQVGSLEPGYERDVAEGLRREATGRLLALEVYPAWKLLWPLYSGVLALLLAVLIGIAIGESIESRLVIGFWALSTATVMGFSVFRISQVVRSRQLVTAQYLGGEVIHPEEHFLDPTTWKQRTGMVIGPGGLSIVLIDRVAWMVDPGRPPLVVEPLTAYGLVLLIVGFSMSASLFTAGKLKPEYPRTLRKGA
jgi:hypothetical protein